MFDIYLIDNLGNKVLFNNWELNSAFESLPNELEIRSGYCYGMMTDTIKKFTFNNILYKLKETKFSPHSGDLEYVIYEQISE